MAKDRTAPQKVALALIKGYQKWISPLLGNNCRFQPTCSNYATQAIIYHGVVKGCWLATKRILKCHPLNAGGEDPVPLPKKEK